jgi:hypothetical protein
VVVVDDEPLAPEDEYDVDVTCVVISAEAVEVKEALDIPVDEGAGIEADAEDVGGAIGMSNEGS